MRSMAKRRGGGPLTAGRVRGAVWELRAVGRDPFGFLGSSVRRGDSVGAAREIREFAIGDARPKRDGPLLYRYFVILTFSIRNGVAHEYRRLGTCRPSDQPSSHRRTPPSASRPWLFSFLAKIFRVAAVIRPAVDAMRDREPDVVLLLDTASL